MGETTYSSASTELRGCRRRLDQCRVANYERQCATGDVAVHARQCAPDYRICPLRQVCQLDRHHCRIDRIHLAIPQMNFATGGVKYLDSREAGFESLGKV